MKTFRMISFHVAAMVLILCQAACSKEEEEGTEAKDLVGTWATSCMPDSDDGHIKEVFVLGESSGTISVDYYSLSDVECQTSQFTLTAGFDYTTGGKLDNPENSLEFDLTTTRFEYTYREAESVQSQNENSYCGATDWVIDTPKDVTVSDCDGDGSPDIRTRTVYDIVKVADDVLQFGNTEDAGVGESADARPTSLGVKTYAKQ